MKCFAILCLVLVVRLTESVTFIFPSAECTTSNISTLITICRVHDEFLDIGLLFRTEVNQITVSCHAADVGHDVHLQINLRHTSQS